MFTSNQMNARLVYNNALNLLALKGYNTASANPAQGYLRSEVVMSTSVTQYHIPILFNDSQNGNAFNTEKRLALQDAFVTSEIGVFISLSTTTVGDTSIKFYTYENPTAFSTSGASAAILSFWQGALQLTINNNQVLPAWDINRCYNVPNQQQATNAYYATTGPSYLDQQALNDDGFYPVEPNLVMNGAANIQMTLILPAAVATLQASKSQRIVVIQRGILCQNITSVK